jgi:capsular polysaccharide biosynthesis protein
MIECLLRLYALQAGCCQGARLLMPEDMTPVQKESFLACLPDNIEVVYLPRRSRVRVDRFIFLSPPTGGTSFYFSPKVHLNYARRCIFDRYNLIRPPARNKRIFISRKKTAYRHMQNQDEVRDMLERDGFIAYDLENLSFSDQVSLFYDAEMVVSPHSSGLINLMFAPPLTKVLEISALAPEPSFFSLSQALGHRYYFLFGTEADRSRIFPRRNDEPQRLRDLINSDFSVDLRELETTIKDMKHD